MTLDQMKLRAKMMIFFFIFDLMKLRARMMILIFAAALLPSSLSPISDGTTLIHPHTHTHIFSIENDYAYADCHDENEHDDLMEPLLYIHTHTYFLN